MHGLNVDYLKCLWLKWQSSRVVIFFIVFITLFLDYMLTSSIVPIMPQYLYQLDVSSRFENNGENFTISCTDFNESQKTIGNNCTWPLTLALNITIDTNQRRHEILENEEQWIGILFASKPAAQLLTNLFIGQIINRIGYSIPMFTGMIIMLVSTLVFAFGDSRIVMLIARTVQGIGSACSSTAGLTMLADRYSDNAERGVGMSFALNGMAVGALLGPPFGGFMYEFCGKAAPFLVLAVLALFNGLLQLSVFKLNRTKQETQNGIVINLLKDPYILICIGAIMIGNLGVASLEASMPIWMIIRMNTEVWEQGVAFLPMMGCYLISTTLFGMVAHKIERWLCCMIGLFVLAASLFYIPFATNLAWLSIGTGLHGIGLAMIEITMLPHIAYLVDIRHSSVYGNAYALTDAALSLSFFIGPLASGFLMNAIGFDKMLFVIAGVCICYSILLLCLRNPAKNDENAPLLMNGILSSNSNVSDQPLNEDNDK